MIKFFHTIKVFFSLREIFLINQLILSLKVFMLGYILTYDEDLERANELPCDNTDLYMRDKM